MWSKKSKEIFCGNCRAGAGKSQKISRKKRVKNSEKNASTPLLVGKFWKKFGKIGLGIFAGIFVGMVFFGAVGAQRAPSFHNDFAKHLTDQKEDEFGRREWVFSICIDRRASILQNVQYLFFPSSRPFAREWSFEAQNLWGNCDAPATSGGFFWDILRWLGGGVLFLFLFLTGADFLLARGDEKNIKMAQNSLLYILIWAFLFFGSTRILGIALDISDVQGLAGLRDAVENELLLQVLAALKGGAFFLGILVLVWTGVKLLQAPDQEEKVKAARTWILRVVLTLILIRVVDYLYFIAAQPDFVTRASDFILDLAAGVGYVLGGIFVLVLIYSGFLLVTSQGNEERLKKAKNGLTGIALSAVVIFLFLLILYQVLQEFGA